MGVGSILKLLYPGSGITAIKSIIKRIKKQNQWNWLENKCFINMCTKTDNILFDTFGPLVPFVDFQLNKKKLYRGSSNNHSIGSNLPSGFKCAKNPKLNHAI